VGLGRSFGPAETGVHNQQHPGKESEILTKTGI